MERRESIALILVATALTMVLFWVIPATHFIVVGLGKIGAFIWMVIAGILVGAAILLLPALAGGISKGFIVASIDRWRMPTKNLDKVMHRALALIGGIATGLVHATVMMPWLMSQETWVRWIATDFGWVGYETPPMFWFWWGLIIFGGVYLKTPYLLKKIRPRRESNFNGEEG